MQQTNPGESEEDERNNASPPLLSAIPESVVEAMGLVMQAAQAAAEQDLIEAKAVLDAERAAFEAEKSALESQLAQAHAALVSEQRAHQQTINDSQDLRSEALAHDDVVEQLKHERDALQQRYAQLEARRAESTERLKRAQLEIYTLKAEVGDLVSEVKRLKRAGAPTPQNDTE